MSLSIDGCEDMVTIGVWFIVCSMCAVICNVMQSMVSGARVWGGVGLRLRDVW